eukprot:TRINITY_DN9027_c0_g1_i1.p1 TRINITY_DN9027_c0_g1~~TRINITY_DN9027_c0_g1_i1.p1  ORF type:complete len:514 (+),score=181.84 TRINITY_DN9027_c0_g1_i1:151-1542(+)
MRTEPPAFAPVLPPAPVVEDPHKSLMGPVAADVEDPVTIPPPQHIVSQVRSFSQTGFFGYAPVQMFGSQGKVNQRQLVVLRHFLMIIEGQRIARAVFLHDIQEIIAGSQGMTSIVIKTRNPEPSLILKFDSGTSPSGPPELIKNIRRAAKCFVNNDVRLSFFAPGETTTKFMPLLKKPRGYLTPAKKLELLRTPAGKKLIPPPPARRSKVDPTYEARNANIATDPSLPVMPPHPSTQLDSIPHTAPPQPREVPQKQVYVTLEPEPARQETTDEEEAGYCTSESESMDIEEFEMLRHDSSLEREQEIQREAALLERRRSSQMSRPRAVQQTSGAMQSPRQMSPPASPRRMDVGRGSTDSFNRMPSRSDSKRSSRKKDKFWARFVRDYDELSGQWKDIERSDMSRSGSLNASDLSQIKRVSSVYEPHQRRGSESTSPASPRLTGDSSFMSNISRRSSGRVVHACI